MNAVMLVRDTLFFFALILLRYFLVAGFSWWLLYRSTGGSPQEGMLASSLNLSGPAVKNDIQLSILSAGVFAVAAALTAWANDTGCTQMYIDPRQYGFWYLGISYLLVLVLQDTYFYFLHRLFHIRALFRQSHFAHHQSKDPTPWTSFAFDGLEAMAQSLFLVAIVFLVPLHPVTLFALLITMSVWATVNHLGLQRLPVAFPHSWLGSWFIGPAHHSLHHQKHAVHFGLYFTFWDRLLGTEDPAYLLTPQTGKTTCSPEERSWRREVQATR